jgi:hypothetical protein
VDAGSTDPKAIRTQLIGSVGTGELRPHIERAGNPVAGNAPFFVLGGLASHTRWDTGVVPSIPCGPPDEPIYLYLMTLSSDGNDYPILHFMDANQPTQITGYQIYCASEPGLINDPSSLFATDVIDMDAATPNNQWVDISRDVSPTGIWYLGITAYNNRCPAQTAEGPF